MTQLPNAAGFAGQEVDACGRLTAALGLSDLAAARLRSAVAEAKQPPAVAASLLGLADEDAIATAASQLTATPLWTGSVDADVTLPAPVSETFLTAHYAMLLGREDDVWLAGLADPSDEAAREGLAFALGKVRFHTIPLSLWRRAQKTETLQSPLEAASVTASWTDDAGRLRDFNRDAPTVRLADNLLERAFLARASDIHVEQKSDCALVRFRVDGLLREIERLPPSSGPPLIARVKVLCDLDVAARRAPQDGRTTVSVRGQAVDIRVSTTPTVFGESLVVRLLHRRGGVAELRELGFSAHILDVVEPMLERQQGLILVTGPTGSGKTTTLYAALRRLASQKRKILTIEDPVEYVFEDINQSQVNEAAGLTFASALRAFLRHDPDVILVGEIRDPETARLAVQASLTGHLVLATLHTNDSVAATPRLVDMGIERYLLAGVLIGAVAQRLIPALCASCKRPDRISPAARSRLVALGLDDRAAIPNAADGCSACAGSGRSGRIPVGEAYAVDETLERLIAEGATTGEVRGYLTGRGFEPFERDAAVRALRGELDLDEALRATAR